jgi:hypothetical protein
MQCPHQWFRRYLLSQLRQCVTTSVPKGGYAGAQKQTRSPKISISQAPRRDEYRRHCATAVRKRWASGGATDKYGTRGVVLIADKYVAAVTSTLLEHVISIMATGHDFTQWTRSVVAQRQTVLLTTPYTPKCDAEVERVNRTRSNVISRDASPEPRGWHTG